MKAYELRHMIDYVNEKHRNRIFTPDETKNGYYSTYVDDKTKARGRRKITRKDKTEFFTALYEYYHGNTKTETRETQKQRITLAELYPEWLEKKRTETTAENYIRRIDTDWKKYYKDSKLVYKNIADIEKSEIERWLLLVARGQGHGIPKTKYYNITVILRQMMEYAHQRGIISHNTFRDVHIDTRKLLQKHRKKPDREEVFSNEEMEALRAYCLSSYENPDYHTRHHLTPLAVLFQTQTGLRIGELCALRWEDITDEYLYIRRMYRYETREVVPHGKTANADRMLPLTQEAKNILKEVKNYQTQHETQTGGYVFSETGKPLPPPVVNKFMRKVCAVLGGHLRNTHKIRKTVISALVDNGVNLETVRHISGHSSARTTLDAYVYDRNLTESASKIDSALTYKSD